MVKLVLMEDRAWVEEKLEVLGLTKAKLAMVLGRKPNTMYRREFPQRYVIEYVRERLRAQVLFDTLDSLEEG